MDLTTPLSVAALKAAFPRDTRGMADPELLVLLEVQEAALRSHFGVVRTDTEAGDALRRAMIASWPSFLQQVRQVAIEDASASGYSVTYNRSGVVDFAFPAFIGSILGTYVDADAAVAAPSTTELVR